MWPGVLPLAHGALGILDELFLILAIGIFVAVLVGPSVIALANRGARDTDPTSDDAGDIQSGPARDDHFRLD
jgi:hypothetical protein